MECPRRRSLAAIANYLYVTGITTYAARPFRTLQSRRIDVSGAEERKGVPAEIERDSAQMDCPVLDKWTVTLFVALLLILEKESSNRFSHL